MNIEKVKQYFWAVLTLLIVVLVVNVVFFVMPTIRRYGDSLYAAQSISVSAEGKATATPDIAQFSFSVVSRGYDPKAISELNNKKVSDAIAYVKEQGIEDKDIKTTGYNLSPDYEYDETTRRSYITGYTLTQTVGVKVRDLGKIAEVIGGLTPLGVNSIGGIDFTVDDQEKVLREARKDAFEKAKVKAKEMAEASGVRLGRVMNVNEFMSGSPVPYYSKMAEGMGGGIALPSVAPAIEPGSEELRVQVSITYAIQ